MDAPQAPQNVGTRGTIQAAVIGGVGVILAAGVTGLFQHFDGSDEPQTPPVSDQSASAISLDVANVTITSEVTEFNVRCPTTVLFKGSIDVAAGKGEIVYRFIRGDGVDPATDLGERRVVLADGPGTIEVDDPWTPSIPDGRVARTEILEVVSPTTIRSEPFTVRGTCDSSLPAGPPEPPPSVAPPN